MTDKEEPKKILTIKRAYAAMFFFLEEYYESHNRECEEIGSMLSSMDLICEDGSPGDQAYWSDWENAVRAALKADIPGGDK